MRLQKYYNKSALVGFNLSHDIFKRRCEKAGTDDRWAAGMMMSSGCATNGSLKGIKQDAARPDSQITTLSSRLPTYILRNLKGPEASSDLLLYNQNNFASQDKI